MTSTCNEFTASEAANRLGVSVKALRLYEERGFITPSRTASGWRIYSAETMEKASAVVALRSLGLSLARIGQVMGQDSSGLEEALAAHEADLTGRAGRLAETIEHVRLMRSELARGAKPDFNGIGNLVATPPSPIAAFDLPWPWGGEPFELRSLSPITYVVGPLFSGKTRFSRCLADNVEGAIFVGLDRLETDENTIREQVRADPRLDARMDRALAWLGEDGATPSPALSVLLLMLEADEPAIPIIDLIEQDLDADTQRAFMAYLRRRGPTGKPVIAITRSSEILDLDAVGQHEAILHCPANHSPPFYVRPHSGARGFEAVATCLAPPDVRARSEGVIAWRPPAA